MSQRDRGNSCRQVLFIFLPVSTCWVPTLHQSEQEAAGGCKQQAKHFVLCLYIYFFLFSLFSPPHCRTYCCSLSKGAISSHIDDVTGSWRFINKIAHLIICVCSGSGGSQEDRDEREKIKRRLAGLKVQLWTLLSCWRSCQCCCCCCCWTRDEIRTVK